MPIVKREPHSEVSTIHVVPGNGGWIVHVVGDVEPECVHENATEAQSVARRIADRRGLDAVVVHDRYHRLHVTQVLASTGGRASATRG